MLEADTCPTLAVLPDLARLLPDLEELGLFVDTSSGTLEHIAPITHTFNYLSILAFGTSRLPSEKKEWNDILLLLGQLLPSDCVIDTSPSSSLMDFRVREGDKAKLQKRRDEWEALDEILHIALQVRSSTIHSISDGRSELEDWMKIS